MSFMQPVIVGLCTCFQYGGRWAVQQDPGERRPGLHWERWGLMDGWMLFTSQHDRQKRWTTHLHSLLRDTGIASGLRDCVFLFSSQRHLRLWGTLARPSIICTTWTSHTETSRCGADTKLTKPIISFLGDLSFDVLFSPPAREPAVHHYRKKWSP